MGFSSAVLFCLYKPVAENDLTTISILMRFFRTIYRNIGVFVLVLGIGISIFLPHFIKDEIPTDINLRIVFYLYLINTCASYLLWGYRSTLLLAHQRNDIESKIVSLSYFVQYVFQAISLIVFANFYIYAISLLLSTIIANILRKIISDRLYPQIECIGAISQELKSFIGKKVAGAFIQKICGTTRTSLGPIFVSLFLGLNQVAIYDNYLFIITSVKGTLDLVISAITTSIGDSIARESCEKNFNDLRKFTFIYSIIGGLCTICILCLIQPFINFWIGSDYMFGTDTVVLLCLYFYILTIGDVRYAYIVGAGLWWEGRYRSVAETVVNITLICVLGYYFGVNGIIIATLLSVLLINFFWGNSILFDNYFKNAKQSLFYKDTALYFIVTCLIGGVCYLVSSKIFINNSVLLILINALIVLLICPICYYIIYKDKSFFSDAIKFVKL